MAKKKIDIKKNIPEIELITPAIAEKYLGENINNRKINKKIIAMYAKDMRSGDWLPSSAMIAFSDTGKLLDGQHRLHAIIQADTPIECYVIRGIPDASFKVIDCGKRRSATDTLYTAGFQNTAALAGALRIIGILEETKNKNIYPGIFRGARLTNSKVLELAQTKKGMPDAVAALYGEYAYVNRLLGPSSGAALFYVLFKKDKELAKELFYSLATGINLSEDSVIRSCREKLIKNLTAPLKLTIGDRIVLVIRTWNFLRQGVRDKKLIVMPNSPVPEIL